MVFKVFSFNFYDLRGCFCYIKFVFNKNLFFAYKNLCFKHNIFMKNTVLRGTVVLVLSGFVCKILGAFFRLPLSYIIGIDGLGIYQLVCAFYSLLLVFSSGGATNSLSKLISSYRVKKSKEEILFLYRYCLLFVVGLSFCLSTVLCLFAKQISSMQGIENGQIVYYLFLVLVPLGGINSVLRGFIQGFEDMKPTAISQIVDQLARFVFGLGISFLLIKFGPLQGVFGVFLALILSQTFSLFVLFSSKKKLVKSVEFQENFLTKQNEKTLKPNEENADKQNSFSLTKETQKQIKKEFLKAFLPLTIGCSFLPIAGAVESLFVVKLLSFAGIEKALATALYGVQTGVVGGIMYFPCIFSVALANACLPKISYLTSEKNTAGQKKIISSSLSILWFVLIPIVVGICAISQTLYPLIFPSFMNSYKNISFFLTILSGINICLLSCVQVLISVVQAKGFFTYSMICFLCGAGVKILMFFILCPQKNINIFSVPISNIFCYFAMLVLILAKIYNVVKLPFFNFALPLLSSMAMFFIVKISLSLIGGFWGLLLAVFVGGVSYFAMSYPILKEFLNMIKMRKNDKNVEKD